MHSSRRSHDAVEWVGAGIVRQLTDDDTRRTRVRDQCTSEAPSAIVPTRYSHSRHQNDTPVTAAFMGPRRRGDRHWGSKSLSGSRAGASSTPVESAAPGLFPGMSGGSAVGAGRYSRLKTSFAKVSRSRALESACRNGIEFGWCIGGVTDEARTVRSREGHQLGRTFLEPGHRRNSAAQGSYRSRRDADMLLQQRHSARSLGRGAMTIEMQDLTHPVGQRQVMGSSGAPSAQLGKQAISHSSVPSGQAHPPVLAS